LRQGAKKSGDGVGRPAMVVDCVMMARYTGFFKKVHSHHAAFYDFASFTQKNGFARYRSGHGDVRF
jgi:hypothetical protein